MEVAGHWLDDGLVTVVFGQLSPKALAKASRLTKRARLLASEISASSLLRVMGKCGVAPLPKLLSGPRFEALASWWNVEASLEAWFIAQRSSLLLGPDGRVMLWRDASGKERHAKPCGRANPFFASQLPAWNEASVPGCANGGAIEWGVGQAELKTAKFAAPLAQPLSLLVVAKASGDTTILDSLSPESQQFEVCHGFPSVGGAGPPAICISADGVGRKPPSKLQRGSTRSNGEWHVYSVVFDGERSAIYVDGVLESSGKSVGGGKLDGLTIGGDHTGTYNLRGAVAELRVYSCHLEEGPRAELEASLAVRYGLTPACVAAAEENQARRARGGR